MNITTKHLHALPFWDHLNHAEKDLLQNNAYIRSFDRDSYIIHSKAGEDIGLMMLVEGRIRAYLLSPDGREITLFSLHDQSICIFSALSLFNQLSFQVFLTSDFCSKVLIVNMSIMEQLMRNNLYFRCFAYELIAERFNMVMDSMQWISVSRSGTASFRFSCGRIRQVRKNAYTPHSRLYCTVHRNKP